jgi:hypothetical protein
VHDWRATCPCKQAPYNMLNYLQSPFSNRSENRVRLCGRPCCILFACISSITAVNILKRPPNDMMNAVWGIAEKQRKRGERAANDKGGIS